MLDLSKHPFNRRHDIDSAMNIILEYYKKWFIPLFLISFASSLLTNIMVSGMNISQLQDISDPLLLLEAFKPFISKYIIIALVGLLFSVILQYYVLVKPIEKEGNLFEWISRVLTRFFLPLLVVYIILSVFAVLAFTLGLVLLIIGAFFAIFYVLIFFTLAAPVIMAEETSISGTISRVFKLGHKKFGVALGWTALYILLIIVISLLLTTLTMIPFGAGVLRSFLNPESQKELVEFAQNPVYIFLASLAGALTMPFQSIFGLVLYFTLRSYEEESEYYSDDSGSGGRVTIDDLTP